ncbi:hypothetical protein [Luteolibacter soli]|uniref:Outer membrane lipoprotein-sorting protein n=1 Tax=Luteolibacter soli TaxID=3135280 RepID=A0ABU9AWP0_9BACT
MSSNKPPRDGLGHQKVKTKASAGSFRPWSLSKMRKGLGFQTAKRKNARETGIGAAPSMGQVGRMIKTTDERLPIRYVTAAAIFFFGCTCMFIGATAAAAVLWWFSGGGGPKGPKTIQFGTPVTASHLPAPEPAEMEKSVTAFLAARTPRDLDPLIRSSSLSPDEIVTRMAALEAADGKVRSVRYLRPIDSRTARLESVLVTFSKGGNRIAFLSPDANQQWRVDFDGYARYVHPSWDQILKGSPEEATVRVQVIPDNYYNGIYRDEQSWACFALPSPDHETLIFGYVARGTPQHAALVSTMNRTERRAQGGLQRMTLKIRHTDGSDRRQFEITRVLSDEWALGDQPLDDQLAGPLSK